MKVFIDLCCGLGGASEAFLAKPGWFVVRIDNNADLLPLVSGMTVCDITDVNDTITVIQAILLSKGIDLDDLEKLVIWASPPCTEFSLGYNAPGPTAARNGEEFNPDLSIMEACADIIDRLMPDHHYIENVRGSLKHFTPVLGPFRQKIGSFFLWGSFPMVDFTDNQTKYLKKMSEGSGDMRAQMRAKVPLEISQAILESIDNQTTLDSYFAHNFHTN